MAHKKRKTAKPPSRSFQNPWDLFRAAGDSPEKLWRWFWPLLAAGFALRAVAALGGNFLLRPDEGMQHLEQAHRLVFGYGFIPWEFRVGARSWLIALPAALPLGAAKALGLEHPDEYMEAVEIFHAALSMSVPVGMFFLARNHFGESAARAALVLGCLWHEFVVFAPHALSEFYGAYFIFAGLALLSPAPSRGRVFSAGLLFGLALAFRPHYATIVLGIAAAWALSLRTREDAPSRLVFGALGGVAAAAVFWAVEWTTWGFPHFSWWTNFLANTAGDVAALSDGHPLHTHLVNLAVAGGGACLVAVALGAARWRRHGLILALALPALALHLSQRGQFYTLIFAVVPLLLTVAADETARALASRRLRGVGAAAVCALSAVAVAGFAGKLPHQYSARGAEQWNAHYFPLVGEDFYLSASRFLSRLPPEEMGAVVWLAADPIPVGGYYKIHRRVPIYFPGMASHAKLLEGRDWRAAATHIVSHRPLEGLELMRDGVFKIYKTGAAPSAPLPDYYYDLGGGEGETSRMLMEKGVIGEVPPPTPFAP